MRMVHPSLNRLRSFVDDEPGTTRHRVARHLAHCPECRKTVSSMRELKNAVREATDPRVPDDAWSKILARRERGEEIILPTRPPTVAPGQGSERAFAGRSALGRAAVLVLTVAGVASATLPGSPVRAWWERTRDEAPVATPVPDERVSPPTPANEGVDSPVSGMSVPPLDGGVQVALDGARPDARIRVRLSEGDEVEVEMRGSAAGALFRTEPGRIGVAEVGAGEVLVHLPRSLRRATLTVDGVPYLVKDEAQIRVLAPDADTTGAEFLFAVQP